MTYLFFLLHKPSDSIYFISVLAGVDMAARKGAGAKKTTAKYGPEYKMVKSVESDSLNYVTSRMGEIVTEEMSAGWIPHGTPMTLIEDGKYILVQAMVRGV